MNVKSEAGQKFLLVPIGDPAPRKSHGVLEVPDFRGSQKTEGWVDVLIADMEMGSVDGPNVSPDEVVEFWRAEWDIPDEEIIETIRLEHKANWGLTGKPAKTRHLNFRLLRMTSNEAAEKGLLSHLSFRVKP